MHTKLLDSLYEKYKIADLKFGIIHDKLGDAYEEYCVKILKSSDYLNKLKKGKIDCAEIRIMKAMLDCYSIDDYSRIDSIDATNTVPHRSTGGNSKTDVIATLEMGSKKIILPFSCKQSTVPKVALAEFDVDTICSEMGITDARLKELLLKHQTDRSAKNFTSAERQDLIRLMEPIRRDFVRWVLTGSPKADADDVCIPSSIIKFRLKKPGNRNAIDVDGGDFEFLDFFAMPVENYMDTLMKTKNGTPRKGGFGTGLSWTYATGSRGKKIQFKG